MIIIAIVVPNNVGPVIALAAVGIFLVYWSSPAEKKLKQLEAMTKPPVYAHLTATLEGLFSIRAYTAQKRFDDINLEKLDLNHEALFGTLIGAQYSDFSI